MPVTEFVRVGLSADTTKGELRLVLGAAPWQSRS